MAVYPCISGSRLCMEPRYTFRAHVRGTAAGSLIERIGEALLSALDAFFAEAFPPPDSC